LFFDRSPATQKFAHVKKGEAASPSSDHSNQMIRSRLDGIIFFQLRVMLSCYMCQQRRVAGGTAKQNTPTNQPNNCTSNHQDEYQHTKD